MAQMPLEACHVFSKGKIYFYCAIRSEKKKALVQQL